MADSDDRLQIRRRIGAQVRELLRLAPTVHEALAERLGVGVTDLLALDHTTSAPAPLGVVELAERLNIRSASATVLVDRLVSSGHLERRPHPTDRRRISLEPTAAAHENVRAALDPLITGLAQITENLTADEADVILAFFGRLTATLEAFADSASAGAAGELGPPHTADNVRDAR